VVDNTAGASGSPSLRLVNTENGVTSPGTNGYAANFIDFYGYKSKHTYADAVTTSGSAILTSATATFVPEDAGKPISGAGIPGGTTILSQQSATQVTLSANATATATGVAISFSQFSDVGPVAVLDSTLKFLNSGLSPVNFTTGGGVVDALQVQQPSGASACINVTNNGTGDGIRITQNGAGRAMEVFGVAGNVSIYAQSVDYGPLFATTSNGGETLRVRKTGTGNGIAFRLSNKGTDPSLTIDNDSTGVFFQVDAVGRMYMAKATAPATNAAGGTVYLDASGNLHFKGAAGTDTQLAVA
jgi:hypothetical protein